uniref:SH3 domain-containing protein n=1 Tax=Leptobrachium leishanense TaxID=445787 RepID=A0A8C5R2V1_9ANUR
MSCVLVDDHWASWFSLPQDLPHVLTFSVCLQKIFIPCNLLEPMKNLPKPDMKKAINGIPLPPLRTPPTRPKVKPAREQQGNAPSFPEGIPPRPDGKPPEPYKMNDFIPREGAVEICDPCTQEAATDSPNLPRTSPDPSPLHPDAVMERSVPVSTGPAAVERTVHVSTGPAVERSVPLGLYPPVEKSVLVSLNTATERSAPPDPATERSAPPDPATERSAPPRTDQASDDLNPRRIALLVARDVLGQRWKGISPEPVQVEENVPPRKLLPPPDAGDEVTLQVRAEFTVSLKTHKDLTYTELQGLLRDKLQQHAEQMKIQLSYREADSNTLTPVNGDRDLRGILEQAPTKRLMFLCKDARSCLGRAVLYRMQAVYEYPAEGPEDLTFIPGEIIDILSEVNEEWLEGHCNGNVGIFPKCFASRFEDE